MRFNNCNRSGLVEQNGNNPIFVGFYMASLIARRPSSGLFLFLLEHDHGHGPVCLVLASATSSVHIIGTTLCCLFYRAATLNTSMDYF
jgi:hypothetical protein